MSKKYQMLHGTALMAEEDAETATEQLAGGPVTAGHWLWLQTRLDSLHDLNQNGPQLIH